ncbi:GTP-binding protein LepA [Kribbella antibiotica]|uniref:GTP-binding protein LepA n=1 Tax=Kribbella antibiotica TaxID=190195 RepID=A0A4R4Z0K3_9ACTN|nr:GTP-binding protein LepA [Kribbella antibiotica]
MREHVDRLGAEHPPIPLDSADFTMKRPDLLVSRFGATLAYMTRVELEVERNVLELNLLLPDPPPVDKYFYDDVWGPQEIHHGLLLDRMQTLAGLPVSAPNVDKIDFQLKLLGALAHLSPIQDISRMLYYLTGVATEKSAILAYNLLYKGLLDLGEKAVASTIIAPIRRQEPGHFAYYKIAAIGLWNDMAPWQKWLTRLLRKQSFEVVGAYNRRQRAEFGGVMEDIGITADGDIGIQKYAQQVGQVEMELLWAQKQGLQLPTYVLDSFRSAFRLFRRSSR